VKEFSLQRKRLVTQEEFRSIAAQTLPARAAAVQTAV